MLQFDLTAGLLNESLATTHFMKILMKLFKVVKFCLWIESSPLFKAVVAYILPHTFYLSVALNMFSICIRLYRP